MLSNCSPQKIYFFLLLFRSINLITILLDHVKTNGWQNQLQREWIKKSDHTLYPVPYTVSGIGWFYPTMKTKKKFVTKCYFISSDSAFAVCTFSYFHEIDTHLHDINVFFYTFPLFYLLLAIRILYGIISLLLSAPNSQETQHLMNLFFFIVSSIELRIFCFLINWTKNYWITAFKKSGLFYFISTEYTLVVLRQFLIQKFY